MSCLLSRLTMTIYYTVFETVSSKLNIHAHKLLTIWSSSPEVRKTGLTKDILKMFLLICESLIFLLIGFHTYISEYFGWHKCMLVQSWGLLSISFFSGEKEYFMKQSKCFHKVCAVYFWSLFFNSGTRHISISSVLFAPWLLLHFYIK